MCQVLNADLEIMRFRNGCKPSYKCARIQVTRILESNTKKHVRGKHVGIYKLHDRVMCELCVFTTHLLYQYR